MTQPQSLDAARGKAVAGFLKRMLVAAAGVVLGMAVVAGIGPLRHLLAKNAERPAPPPLQGERAPDVRV